MVMNLLKGNFVIKINNWKLIIFYINVENFYIKFIEFLKEF